MSYWGWKELPLRCLKCNAIQASGGVKPSHCWKCGSKRLVK